MAITSELSVTPDEVRAKGVEIGRCAEEAEANYKKLYALVNETASYWQGDAGNAFRTSMENLNPSMEAIYRQLKTYSERISQMMDQYEAAEQGNMNVSRGLDTDI